MNFSLNNTVQFNILNYLYFMHTLQTLILEKSKYIIIIIYKYNNYEQYNISIYR